MSSYLLAPFRALLRPWLMPALSLPVHLTQNLSPVLTIIKDAAAPIVKFKRLTETAVIPFHASKGAAGMDLVADNAENVMIYPGERALIGTGIAMALPEGWEAQIRPRSGLANKFGLTVLNTPGTIDADYRGEVKVLLLNTSKNPYTVKRGVPIAQMVIARAPQVISEEVEDLDATERGEGGFGSTGMGEAAPQAAA